MKKAADFIEQIFSSISINEHNEVISLFNSWEEIAGSNIASHSIIYDLDGSSLIIHVDHPGWVQMIDLKKRMLLRVLNQKYPELNIERIVTYVV